MKRDDDRWLSRPKAVPLYQSAAYTFSGLDDVETVQDEPGRGFIYARYAHPNAEQLERAIAGLEGSADCVVTASGMAAMFCALAAVVRPGDHVIAQTTLYGGTMSLLREFLSRWDVQTTFSAAEVDAVKVELRDSTRAIVVETIGNPLLEVADVQGLGLLAREHDIELVVDNTFATPLGCKPLAVGATIVIESVTKFLAGHSDLILGAAAGSKDMCEFIRATAKVTGPTVDPFAAWLCGRSLRTFELRQRTASDNALAVARFLADHTAVARVFYPGLESHPHYRRAGDLLTGSGAMVTMELTGGRAAADQLIKSLSRIEFVPSLGDVETTLSHPATTSHRGLTSEERQRRGISDALVRLSIGCEPVQLIIEDLDYALART